MKNPVLTNGIAAGILLSSMFAISVYLSEFQNKPDLADTIGKILFIAAFSMVFFAIRNQRDRINQGSITFNQAFRIAILVITIATGFYVATKTFYATVIDKEYIDRSIDQMILKEFEVSDKNKSLTEQERAETIKSIEKGMEQLKSPWLFMFTAILDIYPMGLVIAVLCALLMRREKQQVVPVEQKITDETHPPGPSA
jgi:Protein of unknown function (DUF4199)